MKLPTKSLRSTGETCDRSGCMKAPLKQSPPTYNEPRNIRTNRSGKPGRVCVKYAQFRFGRALHRKVVQQSFEESFVDFPLQNLILVPVPIAGIYFLRWMRLTKTGPSNWRPTTTRP